MIILHDGIKLKCLRARGLFSMFLLHAKYSVILAITTKYGTLQNRKKKSYLGNFSVASEINIVSNSLSNYFSERIKKRHESLLKSRKSFYENLILVYENVYENVILTSCQFPFEALIIFFEGFFQVTWLPQGHLWDNDEGTASLITAYKMKFPIKDFVSK